MFIELSEFGPKDLIININNIVSVARDNDLATIYMASDESHAVRESYEEVKALIEREVQAERGNQNG